MKTNNTFSLQRFITLLRQSIIHNQKLLLLSLAGCCGVIFILLLLVQLSNDFRRTDPEEYTVLFFVLFSGFAILSAGTAFPAFRAKERTIGYLLTPASVFEKYLMEFTVRILLVLGGFPFLFLAMFHLETQIVHMISSAFPLEQNTFSLFVQSGESPDRTTWTVFLGLSIGLLSLVTAFTGASMFTRYPLIKTAFFIAIIFFFHLLLTYLFDKALDVFAYNVPRDGTWLVPGNNPLGSIKFFTRIFLGGSVVLVIVSYLKLKEKEV